MVSTDLPNLFDTPHVAVLIETSRSYGRGLLRGVRRYLKLHGPWSVFVAPRALDSTPPSWLKGWRGNGILTRTSCQRTADLLKQVGVPTVELRATRLKHDFPFVGVDNRIVGQMVAEHLLECGFRRFAVYGLDTETFFEERMRSFTETVRQAGHPVDVFQDRGKGECPRNWETHQARLAEWLLQLPKPVGVMACTDQLGFWVLDACHRAKISVPEEIAVVGVEDDETLCEVATPPLSSVRCNAERIGFEASRLLELMMAGQRLPANETLIAPISVTVRQSSDILAIEDRDLAMALQLIRRQACKGLTVADILKAVPMSRSSLERKLRALTGRSPQAEINRVQLERVKTLLLETDWNLTMIAQRSGLRSAQILCERFKNSFGITPGAYRTKVRGEDQFGLSENRPR